MKRLVVLASMLASLAAPLAVRAEQPPIIDRNLFFGEVDITGERISPDGQFISFLKPYNGTRNIWVKKTSEPYSAARPVSAEVKRPIRGHFWSQDSKFILYAQDAGGDENFNVYAIDPTLAADPATGVPPTRALTDLRGVRTVIYSVPQAKPDIIYIGLNDRDPRWHDLYELRLSTGEKTLLRKNTERIANWVFDHDATLRLAVRLTEAGDKEFLRVDPDGFKVIYSCDVLEGCGQEGFDAQNKLVYLVTNKGPLNLTELELLDPATGATTPVESDPEKRVDFGGIILSVADYRVLFTKYEDDGVRRYFTDRAFEAQFRWLESQFPGKEVRLGARTTDESLWIVSAHSDTDPGDIYVWNPSGADVGAAIPRPRGIAACRAFGTPALPLQIVGRARHPGLSDAAERLAGDESALDRQSARRSLGAGDVRLQRLRPIPRQPRLRRAAAELPRLHRLRQGLPQCRKRRVGPEDAGRLDLGREGTGGRWNGGPEAGRHCRRLLWRLCDACRRGVHARRLRRGRGHRGTVQPRHSAQPDDRPTGKPA